MSKPAHQGRHGRPFFAVALTLENSKMSPSFEVHLKPRIELQLPPAVGVCACDRPGPGAYYLTFVFLPPPERAAQAEAFLYEGPLDGGSIDASQILNGFIDRTDRILQLIKSFVPHAACGGMPTNPDRIRPIGCSS